MTRGRGGFSAPVLPRPDHVWGPAQGVLDRVLDCDGQGARARKAQGREGRGQGQGHARALGDVQGVRGVGPGGEGRRRA
eukprot:2053626-Rhodomonas_salina.1